MYQIEDFVKYTGKLKQYNNGIAKIIELQPSKILLASLELEQEFWANNNEIHNLPLNDTYLKHLGFEKEE